MESKHAALVSRDHILDVDIRVFSSMLLQNLQGFLDQITQILVLALSVVNFVP